MRGLNKRIAIIEAGAIGDGFGGQILTEVEIAQAWAKLEPVKKTGKNLGEDGLKQFEIKYVLTLRTNTNYTLDTTKHSVVFKGCKYVFSSALEDIQHRGVYLKAEVTKC